MWETCPAGLLGGLDLRLVEAKQVGNGREEWARNANRLGLFRR